MSVVSICSVYPTLSATSQACCLSDEAWTVAYASTVYTAVFEARQIVASVFRLLSARDVRTEWAERRKQPGDNSIVTSEKA